MTTAQRPSLIYYARALQSKRVLVLILFYSNPNTWKFCACFSKAVLISAYLKPTWNPKPPVCSSMLQTRKIFQQIVYAIYSSFVKWYFLQTFSVFIYLFIYCFFGLIQCCEINTFPFFLGLN
jgi:hypothetical protein